MNLIKRENGVLYKMKSENKNIYESAGIIIDHVQSINIEAFSLLSLIIFCSLSFDDLLDVEYTFKSVYLLELLFLWLFFATLIGLLVLKSSLGILDSLIASFSVDILLKWELKTLTKIHNLSLTSIFAVKKMLVNYWL